MRAEKKRAKSKELKAKAKGQKTGKNTVATVTTIKGIVNGVRVPSRILEEQIQQSVKDGACELRIIADGQHGIGGRIWPQGHAVRVLIEGTSGQRVGSMGMPGTEIVVKGSASDDAGW